MLDGDLAHLYDWDRQAKAEVGLFPADEPDGFLAFAYPPFVAIAYAPLAALPYRLAYTLHTVGLLGCLAATVQLLRGRLKEVDRVPLAAFVAVLTFHPVFRSIGGAQNTALSLLLITASFVLVDAERDLGAGLTLGLLLFKPQLAIPMIGLYLLEGRFRVVIGAVIAGAVLYAGTAAVFGADWPAWWWRDGVAAFQVHDQGTNGPNCVGWLGFFEATLGVGTPIARLLGGSLSLATIAVLAAAYWRAPSADRPERTALAAVGVLMISPHAMFYDAGLLALPLLVTGDRKGPTPLLVGLWALSQTHEIKQIIGFTPMFFVCAITLGMAAYEAWEARRRIAVVLPHP